MSSGIVTHMASGDQDDAGYQALRATGVHHFKGEVHPTSHCNPLYCGRPTREDPAGSAEDEQVHVRVKGGDAGTSDGPGQPGFVEVEPVTCSCEWRTMDTGNSFYSRIVKADPKCKVHPPGWGWGT